MQAAGGEGKRGLVPFARACAENPTKTWGSANDRLSSVINFIVVYTLSVSPRRNMEQHEDILTLAHALSCLKMDWYNGHIYGIIGACDAKGTRPLFPSPPAAWVRG